MCITLPCGYSPQTLAKVIAYCEITFSAISLLTFAFLGVILESQSDLLNTVAESEHLESAGFNDLIVFLKLPHSIQTGMILFFTMAAVAGLIFSVVLLQGAQEKNATKVKIWFVITIVGYIVSIPICLFWIYHSTDRINVGFTLMMSYVYGSLCLWVVSAFIEEMRIENISHRPGFKTPPATMYQI